MRWNKPAGQCVLVHLPGRASSPDRTRRAAPTDLRSQDAGLELHAIAHAVRDRIDTDSCYRIFNGNAFAQQVRGNLGGRCHGRAYAGIAEYYTGGVRVGLTALPHEEDFAEEMAIHMWAELEEPGATATARMFHEAALRDAQELLDALADRYDVLTPGGDPATPTFLAPEPLPYTPAVIRDRYPSRFHLYRPRTAPSPGSVAAAS
ncbi:hypothetical protein [Streptomyces sp. NPDC093544]|uniref:hypothetical protein n=1 Tax=Streptomyces sp. NPDC093544 TaxID=3155200 RepID=UPI00341ACB6A